LKKFWLGHLDLSKKVTIIGAGFSGLISAYSFKKNNIEFEILEGSDRVGGKIQSTVTDAGVVESGANAIVLSEHVKKILNELDVTYLESTPHLKRLIFRDGLLKSFPYLSFAELTQSFFKLFHKLPSDHKDLSVFEFWKPLLGEKVCKEVLTPALQGIYATPCENLSFTQVFDQKFNFEGARYFQYLKHLKSLAKGFKSVSFQEGMNSLIHALEKELQGNIKLNQKIENPPPNSLICTDPLNAFQLTSEPALQNIKLNPIYSLTLELQESIPELNQSFGALFPKNSFQILGILCNHQIFNRKKNPSYTFISSKEIEHTEITVFLKEIKISSQLKVLNSYSYKWPKGLPEYNESITQQWEQLERSNYAFFGNYTSKISLRAILEQACF